MLTHSGHYVVCIKPTLWTSTKDVERIQEQCGGLNIVPVFPFIFLDAAYSIQHASGFIAVVAGHPWWTNGGFWNKIISALTYIANERVCYVAISCIFKHLPVSCLKAVLWDLVSLFVPFVNDPGNPVFPVSVSAYMQVTVGWSRGLPGL